MTYCVSIADFGNSKVVMLEKKHYLRCTFAVPPPYLRSVERIFCDVSRVVGRCFYAAKIGRKFTIDLANLWVEKDLKKRTFFRWFFLNFDTD